MLTSLARYLTLHSCFAKVAAQIKGEILGGQFPLHCSLFLRMFSLTSDCYCSEMWKQLCSALCQCVIQAWLMACFLKSAGLECKFKPKFNPLFGVTYQRGKALCIRSDAHSSTVHFGSVLVLLPCIMRQPTSHDPPDICRHRFVQMRKCVYFILFIYLVYYTLHNGDTKQFMPFSFLPF